MPDPSICELDATELSAAIHRRDIGCVETMQAFLERIHTLDPQFNAIVSLRDPQQLLDEAAQHDAMLARGESRGWMHGFPHAIKDLSQTRGLRTTWGSPLFAHFVPQADSLLAQRIRGAGAILIGKTNTPEWGLGSHTYNPVFGITRNAYDPTRSAGGSSGGAAVALALRMVPVADGSDLAGSLRNPAGFNNVFGFRPSRGRVPSYPVDDVFHAQLSTDGPMARNVSDLAALLGTIAGPDPRTPLALQCDASTAAGPLERDATDWRRIRIGWLGDFDGHLAMEPGMLAMTRQALSSLEAIGCTVEPLSPSPGFDCERIWRSFCVLRQMLTGARLKPHWDDPARRALLKPEARWEVEQALALGALDVQAASVARTAWYQHLLGLFGRFDYLAQPTAQTFPFDAEQHWPTEIDGHPMDSYHRWMEVVAGVTLAGLPSISVPAGFDSRGLPAGVQLIGGPRADLSVLQLAHAYDLESGWVRRHRPPALAPDQP
jgi:amidase